MSYAVAEYVAAAQSSKIWAGLGKARTLFTSRTCPANIGLMPNKTDNPYPAAPGELLEIIIDELDAALVESVNLPEADLERDSRTIRGLLDDAEAMKAQLARKKATPTEADNFARRCRKTLEQIFGAGTPWLDPTAFGRNDRNRKN